MASGSCLHPKSLEISARAPGATVAAGQVEADAVEWCAECGAIVRVYIGQERREWLVPGSEAARKAQEAV